jgi:hypothetical protein
MHWNFFSFSVSVLLVLFALLLSLFAAPLLLLLCCCCSAAAAAARRWLLGLLCGQVSPRSARARPSSDPRAVPQGGRSCRRALRPYGARGGSVLARSSAGHGARSGLAEPRRAERGQSERCSLARRGCPTSPALSSAAILPLPCRLSRAVTPASPSRAERGGSPIEGGLARGRPYLACAEPRRDEHPRVCGPPL